MASRGEHRGYLLSRGRTAQVSLLVPLLFGCGPRMPTEAEAREALKAREASIQKVEALFREELEDLIRAPCLPAPGSEVSEQQYSDCLKANDAKSARYDAAKKKLAEEALPKLLDEIGALGLEAKLYRKGDSPQVLQGQLYLPPVCGGGATGNTAPKAVSGVEGRRLGWGLYQTAWSRNGVDHGDGSFHPGIVVESELAVSGGEVALRLCFLTDGTPRPR